MLPQEFLNRMKQMLGAEYEDFLTGYDRPKQQALRVNPLKVKPEIFTEQAPFQLTGVPWEKNGYYYDCKDAPGKHPYHEAGVYYIQEPSAMVPAALLNAQPGERVLDLCAAPGGKSTQIGAAMKGQGILICNEIHPARAKILSENIERMGIINAIVTNETPGRLTENFGNYFDRIMVDAPCSGEGMFRKNEGACEEWSEENVAMCASRQDEILDAAYTMLAPGGRLVYSTCTFAPAENEGSVTRFIERHPDMNIIKPEKTPEMSDGVADWWEAAPPEIVNTVRLWPHKVNGEGHYAAVLQKEGRRDADLKARSRYAESPPHRRSAENGEEKGIAEKEIKEYLMFRDENLKRNLPGIYIRFGEQLYLAPEALPSLQKLKVLRPGLHLGTLKKNRFEPSHALALALRAEDVTYTHHLASNEQQVYDYLNGQTFTTAGEKGWYLLTVDGYSIGWGKLTGQMMKNHYPKGLRKNIKDRKGLTGMNP